MFGGGGLKRPKPKLGCSVVGGEDEGTAGFSRTLQSHGARSITIQSCNRIE
jgi:hypothetical protein